MTTVAWDGETMACDSLSTDSWGLRDKCYDKILVGPDFIVGGAGDLGPLLQWQKHVRQHKMRGLEVLQYGIPEYNKDHFDITLLLILVEGFDKLIYRTSYGAFFSSVHKRMAIGSGRDYAMAAMYLDKPAAEAVKIASIFDNGTNNDVRYYNFISCREW